MTSTLEKYSQIKAPTATSRSFCPLILYHDKPSKQLSINLNVNKHNNRTAIDRHRDKTNEMLEHNAHFWTATNDAGLVVVDDDEADDYLDKDCIKVSPSTSTTSNINSSSSTSGESIATIEAQHGYLQSRSPTIVDHHHPSHYTTSMEEEEKMYYPPLKITNKPLPTTSKETTTTKKRRRGNLPKEVTEFLRKWLIQHKKHPYPAEKEKADLARHTGLTVNQISNWFINARRRILQPMLESENLTAQMMAYPDLVHSPTAASAAGPSSSFIEPSSRRRRHDFYTYQRDFNSADHSPSPPTLHHHHHQMQQQHHYRHDPMEEERFVYQQQQQQQRVYHHPYNNDQMSMR